MENVFMILGLECLVGVGIGFFLCDKESGLSISDIKISSILFVLVNIFLFIQRPMTWDVFWLFLVSWLLLMIGMISGEKLRTSLVRKQTEKVGRQSLQDDIEALLQQITAMAQSNDESVNFDRNLTEITKRIDLLIHSKSIESDQLRMRLARLKELCYQCVRASYTVRAEVDPVLKSDYVNQLSLITGEISTVASTTLSNVENHVRQVSYSRYNAMPQGNHTR